MQVCILLEGLSRQVAGMKTEFAFNVRCQSLVWRVFVCGYCMHCEVIKGKGFNIEC